MGAGAGQARYGIAARIGKRKPSRKLRRLNRKIGNNCQPAAVEPPRL